MYAYVWFQRLFAIQNRHHPKTRYIVNINFSRDLPGVKLRNISYGLVHHRISYSPELMSIAA